MDSRKVLILDQNKFLDYLLVNLILLLELLVLLQLIGRNILEEVQILSY